MNKVEKWRNSRLHRKCLLCTYARHYPEWMNPPSNSDIWCIAKKKNCYPYFIRPFCPLFVYKEFKDE